VEENIDLGLHFHFIFVDRMSQGFGSECQGLGGSLSPENGHRRLTLTKVCSLTLK